MYDFDGKVALITGAGRKRGFGRATALCLTRQGADIVVADVSPTRGSPRPTNGRLGGA